MAYASNMFSKGGSLGGVYELSMWMYHTADAEATVEGSGYFSDFYAKGGKVGDEIRVYIYGTVPASVRPSPAKFDTPTAALTSAAPTQVSTYIVTGITAAGAAIISPNDNIVTPPPPPPP